MPFDGTQLNETAAHLLRAKQYIEEHGWCSEGPFLGQTVCMVQALGHTLTFAGPMFRGKSALFHLGHAIGCSPSYIDGHSVGKWNDTPGRTLDEVYAAFDRAIALAMDGGV